MSQGITTMSTAELGVAARNISGASGEFIAVSHKRKEKAS